MTGLGFGESPRWHEGRLWFSNWGMQEVVDVEGQSEIILRMPSFPFSLDWRPGARLLITSGTDGLLRRMEQGGSLVSHADLTSLARGWNEIVVDGRGNTYIKGAGFAESYGRRLTAFDIAADS